MLNIGLGELLVVLLIAFLVVGPRDLPRVGRWLGRQVRRIRRMNREFREMSGWDDLVSAADDVSREVKDLHLQRCHMLHRRDSLQPPGTVGRD